MFRPLHVQRWRILKRAIFKREQSAIAFIDAGVKERKKKKKASCISTLVQSILLALEHADGLGRFFWACAFADRAFERAGIFLHYETNKAVICLRPTYTGACLRLTLQFCIFGSLSVSTPLAVNAKGKLLGACDLLISCPFGKRGFKKLSVNRGPVTSWLITGGSFQVLTLQF